MIPVFPVIELVDRYSIAKLKFANTGANRDELEFYQHQVQQFDLIKVADELELLYSIHSEIWALEFELKTGREQQLPLEEIGRRAIAIRDLNNQRVSLKNKMAEKLGCVVREIKKDHISQ
jgi:hypothetical protein